MKCPHCQTENLDDAKFCRECAKRFKLEAICPKSGYKNIPDSKFCSHCAQPLLESATPSSVPTTSSQPTVEAQPTSFANGRYQVKKFLGECGKKKVYLAHDSILDSGSGLCTPGFEYTTCIPRQMGGACALLERYEEARKYYDKAIKVCTEMHFRPELALTRLQLTELLLEHYPDEKKEAQEHLDFAMKEFREMKMQPSLERTLRQKKILKA
jgi:hypothetical protein